MLVETILQLITRRDPMSSAASSDAVEIPERMAFSNLQVRNLMTIVYSFILIQSFPVSVQIYFSTR